MRLFQFHSFYKPHINYFYNKEKGANSLDYGAQLALMLKKRFHSIHILDPVYTDPAAARFAVANDEKLQLKWARENGLKTTDLTEILIAQIEDHRAEVVYSLDPVRFGGEFIRRLPGCVKTTVCWFAAPGEATGANSYTIRVCNFHKFLRQWRAQGLRAEWFSPSVDDMMFGLRSPLADRSVDIAFAGLFSRYHSNRNALLEAVCNEFEDYDVRFAFQCPRWKTLAPCRVLNRIPIPVPYIPRKLRSVSVPAVYGSDLYSFFSKAKIVINAAVDVAGNERGNMRCFESMGCGALMLSDDGVYPPDFKCDSQFLVYKDLSELIGLLRKILIEPGNFQQIANCGYEFMHSAYSKPKQWERFKQIV
jgi:hypothetical protein